MTRTIAALGALLLTLALFGAALVPTTVRPASRAAACLESKPTKPVAPPVAPTASCGEGVQLAATESP